jgi:hypothetical protein
MADSVSRNVDTPHGGNVSAHVVDDVGFHA